MTQDQKENEIVGLRLRLLELAASKSDNFKDTIENAKQLWTLFGVENQVKPSEVLTDTETY